MEKLLEIAKKILDVNDNACLTGTLMLKLRGIDLGREPHDIDILFNDFAPHIIIPEELKLKEIGLASDGSGVKYQFDNIVIDIISSDEEPEIVNGLKLGKLDKLIEAKYLYSKQSNKASQKHHDDLIKLGFKFPEEKEIDSTIELPF